jgi:hypothetical protein
MLNLISWELLFWLPTLLDLLLLVVTYGYWCTTHSVSWYLGKQAEVIAGQKEERRL